MDREELLKQITILDFMATDLHLFLNTHPDDAEALKVFNDTVAQSKQARKEYEHHFGPLTSYRSADTAGKGWRWNNCPWPWERDFNFKWEEQI